MLIRTTPEDEQSQQTQDPLPLFAYDVIKEKDLRESLKKFSLSTEGNKEALKARHKQYVK